MVAFSVLQRGGLASGQDVSAGSQPLQYTYAPARTMVLNRDGGPWNHVDIMNLTVDQLRNHVQKYNDGNGSIGPLRLLHAPICLNPVGVPYQQCSSTNATPNRTLSPDDLAKIDAALGKVEQARVKIILRFIYNHSAQGEDAPMDTIVQDMELLAPVVRKHTGVVFNMNAGFVGSWGEGRDSTFGNSLAAPMKRFMAREYALFGLLTLLQQRYPASILAYEPPGHVEWGIHDDDYSGNPGDGGTWLMKPWIRGRRWAPDVIRAFADRRSDQMPFSGEIGTDNPKSQSCDAFDSYSTRLHLNSMNVGFHNTLSQQPCYAELVGRIGPVIALQSAEFFIVERLTTDAQSIDSPRSKLFQLFAQ